jgi:hypothetical protein
MKRRTFIGLVGGAASCPLDAGAQQRDEIPRIGFVAATSKEVRPGSRGIVNG